MKQPRGFTLIELTIVSAIIAVLAGLVIVRWGTFSARQQAIASARQLGNTISQYRERAQSEESLYAIALDLDNNRYSIYRAIDKNPTTIQSTQPLAAGTWSAPVHFGRVFQDDQSLQSPVFLFLDAKGILPNIKIEIQSGTHCITIAPDAVASEMSYDAKD